MIHTQMFAVKTLKVECGTRMGLARNMLSKLDICLLVKERQEKNEYYFLLVVQTTTAFISK